MTTVMAVDPSLTGFCVAVAVPGEPVRMHRTVTKPNGKNPQPRARTSRWFTAVERTLEWAQECDPDLVVVEGPSFGSTGRATLSLAECRAILNSQLLLHARCVVEVPPATLKLFATGKGNASKTLVASELAKRYKRTFKHDDESDCYGLLMLAMAAVGMTGPQTRFQFKAVEQLRNLYDAEREAVT